MQKIDTKNLNIEEPVLLPANESRESLKDLEGWQSTDDHKMIYREFIFHDFMGAVDMIDHIAVIAQDENHHPDIHLTQYRNLRVALTTHDVGGLSEKDFVVASKINELPFSKEHQKLQYKESKASPSVAKKSKKAKAPQAKKALNRVHHRIKKA
jgi:4a-hydroxytetrahydrobiopterin dehydratase